MGVGPIQVVHLKIFQSKTYRKDLDWLHFDELLVQEKPRAYDQQFYIPISVGYPTHPTDKWEHQPRHTNSISFKSVWSIYRDQRQQNFISESKLLSI